MVEARTDESREDGVAAEDERVMTDEPLSAADLRPSLNWYAFEELTVDGLYAVLKLRCDVFVVEQACAYSEIDGRDPQAMHLVAFQPGMAEPVGCLRMTLPDDDGPVEVGRVAVHPVQRGQGLGQRMMQEAVAETARRYGPWPVAVSAQAHLKAFYEGLGFEAVSEVYDDEGGIPHIDMVRPADAA